MGLVSADWLRVQSSAPEVVVCDVRWYLPATGRNGRREYAAGHLPGARFVDLDAELAAPDDGSAGRHPLPSQAVFQAAMRRHGISASTHVVAYDDAGGACAARLWWLLRAHGHERASLLDGGIAAWTAAGGALATEVPHASEGDFTSRPVDGATISLADVPAFVRAGLLLDARAGNRYRGETEPVDARPGHVPGAVNLPFADLLVDGRFAPVEQLRGRFAEAGVDGARAVAASCGSGVTACHLLFAMDLAGVRPFPSARLYTGSYSEWARRKELPVATGGEPS
jgi:thiosulfate/3-mercaptopyruvate sulfurtransferase